MAVASLNHFVTVNMRVLFGVVLGLTVVAVPVRAEIRSTKTYPRYVSTLPPTIYYEHPSWESPSESDESGDYPRESSSDSDEYYPSSESTPHPDDTDSQSTEHHHHHPVDRHCPPGISRFSEHDIKATIDAIMQCSKVVDQVESTIPEFIDMRNVYLGDLDHFIKSIEHKPVQLEGILKMVAAARKQLEPVVYEFNHNLNKTSMYEVKFETIQQEINNTLEKLDRYTRLCELSGCSLKPVKAHYHGLRRHDRNHHRYMCISMNDLKNYISEVIKRFIHEYNDSVYEELQEYKTNYECRIHEAKDGLKERALIAFGRTMFDILLLQDELYNFNLTMKIDADITTHQILNNILELQWKLNVFDKKVELYGLQCGRCKKQILFQNEGINTRSHTKWTGMQLVDELLDEKLDDLKKHMKSTRRAILQVLDDKISQAEAIEVLEKHVELQNNIQDMINAEQLALEKLMKMAPPDKINSMEALLHESKRTLGIIDRYLGTSQEPDHHGDF